MHNEKGPAEAGDAFAGRPFPVLLATPELVRVTLSSISDAVISTDSSGRVTFLNATAQLLTGYSHEEALARPVQDVFRIIHEETRLPVESPAAKALLDGVTVRLANHTILVSRDGVERTIEHTATPTRDESGTVTGVVLVFRDVSARRVAEMALQDSEIRYRRLFQSAQDGILILDARSGKIIDANAFMCGLLGQDLLDLTGRELHEIGLFKDIEENKAMFERLRSEGYVRYDHLPVRSAKGQSTSVEFVSNVYSENGRLVAQCNVRDISVRTRLEEQLKRQSEALADQSRRKDEFLAMLSHELRNPLAPIRSAAHLLKLQEKAGESVAQQQAREVIERQVGHLTHLVNDLLEVSRVVSGRIQVRLELVDVRVVALRAVDSTQAIAERRGQKLRATLPPDPVWVQADAMRLEQIVTNLLDNAVKYTDEGGTISISVESSGGRAGVRVRDSGIGIPADILPFVFDLFMQADRSLDRSQGGLGIGLNLVQHLARLHGGTAEAHSAGAGMGSEFLVWLPLAEMPVTPPAAIAAGDGAPAEKGLRVLVVDDNRDGCAMLARLLEQGGRNVRTAFTGPQALDIARSWRPDVVLLDIGLPGMNGYEVARCLRRDPAFRKTRLIAVTGYGTAADIQLAREAGFDAHLLKPVDLAEVEKLFVGAAQPSRAL